MITSSLDVVKSKPGIWILMVRAGTVFIESDEAGVIYQLKPDTFERDGELRPDGWNLPAITNPSFYGPLARKEEK